jgi:hypothetical protein
MAGPRRSSPGPSGPNSVHVPETPTPNVPDPKAVLTRRENPRHPIKRSTHELTGQEHSPRNRRLDTPKGCQMLLRKEVIQPHLPVRLPCYDLVLITDPTFDGSLHKG